MRLIDADAMLIEEGLAYRKAQSKCENETTKLINEVVHKKIQMLVADTPTAFDVKKIVEELEEERETSYADFTKYVNEYSPCLDDEYDDLFHRGLGRAIKIVKAGGVE